MPRKPKTKEAQTTPPLAETPTTTLTEGVLTVQAAIAPMPEIEGIATAQLAEPPAVLAPPVANEQDLDVTAQRPAVTTGPQRALTRTTVVMPTITLPSIPALTSTTQPRIPAVLSPLAVKADNKLLSKHPTNPVVVIPAAHREETVPLAVPPTPHPHVRARTHRLTLATVLGLALLMLIAFVPVVRSAGVTLPNWVPLADARAYPTPTPSPTPIYPDHPVVSGAGDFICTALPFARLVQVRQAQAGLPHPWYVSVILAQWGVEHGWNIPDYTGYNWGNSSAIPGFPAVGGLNVPGSPGAFAYAYTPLQGVDIYTIFTQMGFYTGVWQNYPNGPVAQAEALGQSPWDAGHYQEGGGVPGQSLLNAMNEFNLYRFDNPNVFC